MQAFQILDGRGLPEVEAAGVLRGGDEGQLDAEAEAEDAVAGDFEVAVVRFVMEQIMFLSAAGDLGRQCGRVQQETQTVCPFTETGFLPGERGRPRCFSISR